MPVSQIQKQTVEVVKPHPEGPVADLHRGANCGRASSTDSITDSSRDVQMQVPAVQVAQKTVKDPQTKSINKVMRIPVTPSMNAVVDVPVVAQHQEPTVHKRDENEMNKLKIETKNSLETHGITIRSTSIVEEMKSKFEVGNKKKKAQEVVHAQKRLDENQW